MYLFLILFDGLADPHLSGRFQFKDLRQMFHGFLILFLCIRSEDPIDVITVLDAELIDRQCDLRLSVRVNLCQSAGHAGSRADDPVESIEDFKLIIHASPSSLPPNRFRTGS